MNEFLTFITSGVVERFEASFKEKALYLLKIIYYSIAIIFTIAIVHELFVYYQTDSLDATMIGRLNNRLDKSVLISNFLYSLIFPFYAAYTLWLCQTKFNHKNISLSIALIISTVACMIIQALNILPKVSEYHLTAFLFMPIIAGALYLIISNLFSYNMIVRGRMIWKKYRLIFTYLYVILFVLFMLYYTETEMLNIIVNIISATFIALMLIYVRRLLGIFYAIVLHYILTIPVIIVTGYMLFQQI